MSGEAPSSLTTCADLSREHNPARPCVDTNRIIRRIKGREPVYSLPDNRAITRDLDGPAPSGAWKVARRLADLLSKERRRGTYGPAPGGDLVRVGP